jgi:hexulose-6-phosphate isomerase
MQAPFWKTRGEDRAYLQSDFLAIGRACSAVGIRTIVVPLVDNGRLETVEQENILVDFFLSQELFLAEHHLQILFESDFAPTELARFIARLPNDRFGINYDLGNSAALGFPPEDEFDAYGSRILNVHVKDRVLGGTTVPLMTGNADFSLVFSELTKLNYKGNYILQTARASDGEHARAISKYRDIIIHWLYVSGLARQN